ncbi:hypothetical protein EJ05DRAFT_504674 [Pseudovirgaria hyperparasitica]|uniref:5-nitroimidazole antibiotic resistance protein n=1 Tax=Pseudovirgaria hyperparasitica TaxID=470096 RepID=A0A6A6VWF0_9PEZI|nr:uncharacterized protein EJ05DRAFT_504674 [Pseudovirgaria hyperparasitica]KAF2753577.1 hypothetical protein EJ05DRAFT_504674 [Pseudovirgaria hyperparasitica]
MSNSQYEKTTKNGVVRYRGRGKYDFETVHSIIDEAPILHVSFTPLDDDFPAILPMFGCMGLFPSDDTNSVGRTSSLYLHGYAASRMFRTSRGEDAGLKITVAATILDGIVLALTPNHHSANYRSAVVFGHAYLVTDEAERWWAMKHVTNSIVPERWENTRIPPTDAEAKATGIIRVEIETGSAKIRTGTTGEDRNDLKDEGLRKRVWAGVLPMWTRYGQPTPAPTNMTDKTPEYISRFVDDSNKQQEDYAMKVAL